MSVTHGFSIFISKFLLLFIVLCLLLGGHPVQAEDYKMPAFQLDGVNNSGPIISEEYKGKVLIVYFWATWCPVCRIETKDFIKLTQTYKDQEFQIIGISVDKSGEKGVLRYMEKMQVNYPIAMATEKITADFAPIAGIPASFIIDKKGNIFKKRMGYIKYKQVVADIEKLLAE